MRLHRKAILLLLPLLFVSAVSARTGDFCGTPAALRAFWAGGKLVRPPSGPEFVYSQHFVVHYATSGQHATNRAYAESVSVYAEYSWRVQIDSLGWIAPPLDGSAGGNSRYDFYVNEMGDTLGATYPESPYSDPYPDGYISYIRVKRDVDDWSLLRVTVAHEFNHASQFRYSHHENVWWMENTATWMEDVCYDDVNDYAGYLATSPSPINCPDSSITTETNLYYYAGAIWAMFLHEYYSVGCPRRCWERMGAVAGENTLAGIDWVLANTYISSLNEALGEYAVWRYFTGARADNAYHFSESDLWPTSAVLRAHSSYPASGNQGTNPPSGPGGTNFIEFTSGIDLLRVTFDGQDGANWTARLIGNRLPEQAVQRRIVLDANQRGTGEMPWTDGSRLVLVAVVTQWNPPARNRTHSYQAELTELGSVDTAWVRRYNGPGNGMDIAYAVASDGGRNVYVTGYCSVSDSSSETDFATVKYSPAGAEQWVARYNGPGNGWDDAYAVVVDGQGNVYVTGSSVGSGTGWDYATVKYNSAGAEQWVRRYNGPANRDDYATAMAVDGSGNVCVTGYSFGSGTYYDYATVKYSSAGAEQWVARYNGPGNSYDEAVAIAVDAVGAVCVTGESDGPDTTKDYATVKYSSAGVEQWVARYNGPANDLDAAMAIALDAAGNVIVAGSSRDPATLDDYATVKYNSAGVQQWVARYHGWGNDFGDALAVDRSGGVHVTGASMSDSNYYDYATIKYASTGTQQWVRNYREPHYGWDGADAIAVDDKGNTYVTGSSESSAGAGYDFATVKYDSLGGEQWVARYNGPGSGDDRAYAISLDGQRAVCVTGWSEDVGANADYATIKYVPCSPPQPLICVSPSGVSLAANMRQVRDTAVVILNNGNADLQWSLVENPPVGWLSESPTNGTVPPKPNNRMDVTLTLNTAGLAPGAYHTNLAVTSNDPDQPAKAVSVELKVREPNSIVIPPVAVDSGRSQIADPHSDMRLPRVFALGGNSPSPFVSHTVIPTAFPYDCPVSLRVYSPSGVLVRTLISGVEQAGFHIAAWDGRNEQGEKAGAGIYYYRIEAGEFTATRKMVKTE